MGGVGGGRWLVTLCLWCVHRGHDGEALPSRHLLLPVRELASVHQADHARRCHRVNISSRQDTQLQVGAARDAQGIHPEVVRLLPASSLSPSDETVTSRFIFLSITLTIAVTEHNILCPSDTIPDLDSGSDKNRQICVCDRKAQSDTLSTWFQYSHFTPLVSRDGQTSSRGGLGPAAATSGHVKPKPISWSAGSHSYSLTEYVQRSAWQEQCCLTAHAKKTLFECLDLGLWNTWQSSSPFLFNLGLFSSDTTKLPQSPESIFVYQPVNGVWGQGTIAGESVVFLQLYISNKMILLSKCLACLKSMPPW